jgi:hypothetical protein
VSGGVSNAAAAASSRRPDAAWIAALILLPLAALGASVALTALDPTLFSNYVYLADAWRHGRLWINYPGEFIDAVPFHGRAYVIEGPTPALLLFPFVCLYGLDTNQTMLGAALGAIAVFAGVQLCRNLGVPLPATILLNAFLFFGTSMYVCASFGSVWYVAHVSAVAFTLLALAELYGGGKGWLVALFALAAAFSRMPMLAAVPVYAGMLWVRPERRRELFSFGAVCLAVAPLSVWYNEARWGSPFDLGFARFYEVMDVEHPHRTGSPFSLSNLEMQIRAFFRGSPPFTSRFPWVAPGTFGTSIQWVSPALVLALTARTKAALPLWLLFGLTAVPAFLYYDAGGTQFGMRHALDFEPFLFALIAQSAARRPLPVWGIILLSYSIAFGIAAAFVWKPV